MELSGEYFIGADQQKVWDLLNDPEILKEAIPGCEEIEKKSDTEFLAKITTKIGPMKTKFAGSVTLSELDPPKSYKIIGEGKGGAAGFAKGESLVSLEAKDNGTVLKYSAQAKFGGKLAQLGARLVKGTSQKLADEFFAKIAEIINLSSGNEGNINKKDTQSQTQPGVMNGADVISTDKADKNGFNEQKTIKPFIWVSSVIALVIILWIIVGST